MLKKPKALYEGKLTIGDTDLNVAVLDNGQRIINKSAIFKAFGRTKRGRSKNESRVPNRPAFIDANNLQPLIQGDLEEVLKQIEYKTLNGKEAEGYRAEILPKLCRLYLEARENGDLIKSQIPLARASEILLLALSEVGIIALVDEATGYQYDREKDELQKILKAYISEELLPWQKKFPDVFYKELFRLNGWEFNVNGIKNRPGVIGAWTNSLIYDELPSGVKDELKKKTPTSEAGNKTVRMHQFLTEDIGNNHLKSQIEQVLTLFRLSDNMKEVWYNFQKLKDRKKGKFDLPFEFDENGYTVELEGIKKPVKEYKSKQTKQSKLF